MQEGTSGYYFLPDQRRLCYNEYGDKQGKAVFYFHGIPASRFEAALIDQVAQNLGLRIISVDRPGYGDSDFQAGRTIMDWPNDVALLADHLELSHFSMLGLSGGSPYVLACCHQLNSRIDRAGVIGGLGEYVSSDYAHQMSPFSRFTLNMAQHIPRTIQFCYEHFLTRLVLAIPRLSRQLLGASQSIPDVKILQNEEVDQQLSDSLKGSFAQGGKGVAYEIILISRTWGFHLEEIETRLRFWHGDEDCVVPCFMSAEHQDKIPDSDLIVFYGEGHFSITVKYTEDILRYFLE